MTSHASINTSMVTSQPEIISLSYALVLAISRNNLRGISSYVNNLSSTASTSFDLLSDELLDVRENVFTRKFFDVSFIEAEDF